MKQSGGLEISIQPLQKPDLPLGSSDLRDNQAEGAAHRSVDRAWLLWENRLLIWRVTLSGLLLATILAFAIRNSYTSVAVGSSRVDLQACKLEYSIVSPK